MNVKRAYHRKSRIAYTGFTLWNGMINFMLWILAKFNSEMLTLVVESAVRLFL